MTGVWLGVGSRHRAQRRLSDTIGLSDDFFLSTRDISKACIRGKAVVGLVGDEFRLCCHCELWHVDPSV